MGCRFALFASKKAERQTEGASRNGERLHHRIEADIERSALQHSIAQKDADILQKIEELRASEETFRAVIDYAPTGMVLTAPDLKWLRVNKALCDLLGYTEEELLKIDPSRLIHPDDLEADLKYVQQILAGDIKFYQIEKRYFHKNGSLIWALLHVSLVWNSNNTPKHFIAQIQDITQVKISEQQREKLIQELMDSNAELEHFAYIASHDMQEPLRMITNFCEIIVTDYIDKLDDTGKEYLGLVKDAGERMRAMVDDLLEYARVGNESAVLKPMNGEKALDNALMNIAELIKERHAEITYDALPNFDGNAVQFMRLLQNLLTNAIKYQSKGNIPKIHVGAEDKGDAWCITVKDNGVGIKEQFIEQVFQPFRRLCSWTDIKGTGIGLAVCKKIVENHGGKIWVTSTPGEGSIFHFTLPKTTPQTLETA